MKTNDLEIIKHFRLLDCGSDSQKIVSLEWLLNLASNQSSYLDGKYSLREHMDVRLISAFSDWPEKKDEEQFLSTIENYYYNSENPIHPAPNAIANKLVEIAYQTGTVSQRARKLISKLNFSWIRGINDDALEDAIQYLNSNPAENEWLIFAFDWQKTLFTSKEPLFKKSISNDLIKSFNSIHSLIKDHTKILFGCSIYSELSKKEKEIILNALSCAEDKWKPYCSFSLAIESIKNKEENILIFALNNLFSLIENETLTSKIRINSARFLCQSLIQAKNYSFNYRSEIIQRLKICTINQEPFSKNFELINGLKKIN